MGLPTKQESGPGLLNLERCQMRKNLRLMTGYVAEGAQTIVMTLMTDEKE